MSITSPARPPVRPAGTPHRPSSLGYWIGGALIAAACIGAAVWAVLAFFGYVDQVDSFQRMTVPGTAIVHVTQPATQVLYYESTGVAPSLAQLGIQVTGPAGNAVTVTAYSGDLRYDVPPAVSFAWRTTGDASLAMVLLNDKYAAAAIAAERAPLRRWR